MTDTGTLELNRMNGILMALNTAFSERYHSLAQYILNARPYLRPGEERILQRISEISEYDGDEAERLAEVIESLGGVPQVGTYHHFIAELNYLTIGHQRDFLMDTLGSQLAAYESSMELAKDCIPARNAFNCLCQALQTHIEALKHAR